MFAAPDHDTNNEGDFQDSYTNLIIGANTNQRINHSPLLEDIIVTQLAISSIQSV